MRKLLISLLFSTLALSGVTFAQTDSAPSDQDLLNAANKLEQSVPQLHQQVNETIQSAQKSQQQVQGQIRQLREQNSALQLRVQELTQQLNAAKALIQNGPVAVNDTDSQNNANSTEYVEAATEKPLTPLQKIMYNSSLDLRLGGGLIILALLLLVWLFWPKETQKEEAQTEEFFEEEPELGRNFREPAIPESPSFDKDLEIEYDFMGSEDAIPVKLDLARAYLEMGERSAAEQVLESVMARGNPLQQEEAKALLSQVK